jgi:predicted Fe-Mo cluster-binding NifX family protein
MKVAVTAKGKTLQDAVDPRFGRAMYIILVDTDSMEFEAIDNSANINAFKGAGIHAASMICERGAEVLLTGYCGPNAYKTATTGGIKVVSDVGGTVEEAINKFKQGELQYSVAPNTEGHW